MQSQLDQLKKQLREKGERAAESKKPVSKTGTNGLIKLGQMILGFKVIKKTVRNRPEYHGYQRIDGKTVLCLSLF